MKGIRTYILIGLGTAFLHWAWVVCGPLFFLTDAEALVLKCGLFLSFEMVILTGILLSRLKK